MIPLSLQLRVSGYEEGKGEGRTEARRGLGGKNQRNTPKGFPRPRFYGYLEQEGRALSVLRGGGFLAERAYFLLAWPRADFAFAFGLFPCVNIAVWVLNSHIVR